MGIIKYFEYLAEGASPVEYLSEFDFDIFNSKVQEDNKRYKKDKENLWENYQQICKDLGQIVLNNEKIENL